MEEEDFLKKFITSYEIEEVCSSEGIKRRYSCLIAALNDARKISGRNPTTGKEENDFLESDVGILNPKSLIGVINYLLILELIGGIFKIESFTTKKTSAIYKALKQFTTICDKDINAIIALRNSLAHNYGLINIADKKINDSLKRKELTHKFTLIFEATPNLIEYPLPSNVWMEKDYSNKSINSSTKISYLKLIDLIELVYMNVVKHLESNSLKLALEMGLDELKARFTFTV